MLPTSPTFHRHHLANLIIIFLLTPLRSDAVSISAIWTDKSDDEVWGKRKRERENIVACIEFAFLILFNHRNAGSPSVIHLDLVN